MATSGSYSFSVVRDDIIREAMLNIGKLGEAENPSAQEVTDCARKLNMLAKQWMARQDFAPGLKVWTRKQGDLFFDYTRGSYSLGPSGDNWTNQSWSQQTTAAAVANATTINVPNANIHAGDFVGIQLDSLNLYWTTVSTLVGGTQITIPATGIPSSAASGNWVYNYTTKAQRPLHIEAISLRDQTFADIPIKLYTVQDYALNSSKAQVGFVSDPTAAYYQADLTNGTIYLDVPGAQDVTKRFRIYYFEAIQDFVNPLDNPEYPQEWYMALSWGLTKQIAPMFNVPFTKDMEENLQISLTMAREAYSETTTLYFQPGQD